MIVSLLALACNNETEEPVGINVGADVDIVFKDENGADLLNPGNSSSISDFKIYYQVNGQKVLYNEPNLDYPGGYRIIQDANNYFLKVYLNTPYTAGSSNGETITYLEINGNKTFEIKSQYNSNPSNVSCEKLWLDGSQVWASSDGWRKFELVIP